MSQDGYANSMHRRLLQALEVQFVCKVRHLHHPPLRCHRYMVVASWNGDLQEVALQKVDSTLDSIHVNAANINSTSLAVASRVEQSIAQDPDVVLLERVGELQEQSSWYLDVGSVVEVVLMTTLDGDSALWVTTTGCNRPMARLVVRCGKED